VSRVALIFSVFLLGAAHSTIGAQTYTPSSTAATSSLNRSLTVGVSHQRLSNGFGTWNDQFVRLVWEQDKANLINAELVHGNRFNESGVLGGISWTRVLDEDWYGNVAYARTNTGLFWPVSQGSGTINRKWLEGRKLVTSLALGFDESRNNYSGRWASLAASYYAPNSVLIGAGVRANVTQPGDVHTHRRFASITWGTRGNAYLSLSYNGGREGYQLLNSTAITNFASREWILQWKQWVSKGAGLEFKAFDYRNSFYQRAGAEASVFTEF
jgi:YaiO family outer membrane protein